MSGGNTEGDDEVNGPSWSGERKKKRSRNRERRSSAAAQTHECVQEKQKLTRNVLDGADFVRDVLDTYLNVNIR